jgi:hypothetical protein
VDYKDLVAALKKVDALGSYLNTKVCSAVAILRESSFAEACHVEERGRPSEHHSGASRHVDGR